MIKPQVEKRLEELANLPPNGKKPNDTLQWLMKNAPPEKANDIVFHASEQLSLSVASIHNTGMNVSRSSSMLGHALTGFLDHTEPPRPRDIHRIPRHPSHGIP